MPVAETSAARRLIARPTAREPVKAISATSGCSTSAARRLRPCPADNCTTPGGNSTSRKISISLAATTLDCSDGFITTVLPVASAAVVMPVRIASGKFHGAMTAATPRGRYSKRFSSPGTSTSRLRSSAIAPRA